MCGIVGLFLKDESLQPRLGGMLTDMLVTMSDRGPDSAGIAVYRRDREGTKITVQSADPNTDFAGLAEALGVEIQVVDTHAILCMPSHIVAAVLAKIAADHPGLRIMSRGEAIEIYKEVGMPQTVADRFAIPNLSGSHGIGHTRMATESAVTTLGAHPFSTGADQCLVHNGSLSNHNRLRRALARKGTHVQTQNDTEVAAAYLTHRMEQGDNLGEALEAGLDDLDGFYTFVVGTKDGFGVLRDPIACKPAVLAETDQYVAFGSEYRALVNLPGIDAAKVWEPEPATVYFWSH
ncbi:class II glutamine amidotransferase [Yoonia sediminilitoris]|uniref:N-methylglutamate synthase subunit A n=1 Tax=Yoonia sediminilitoris TaxID=1286148 RepID=A0A2T6KG06_9RHOB|nr:glutamine amidotransferase family protein [Yoonia sediminilitoris]PUB14265.1 N-methylglutamate synthase subunit A [Yoonia sediminilitoris]RCW95196.1 N-methylglutamate synthase subunit A [Yoonia sediminilitoris]